MKKIKKIATIKKPVQSKPQTSNSENDSLNTKIKKDIRNTLIYIFISFVLLFIIKYLESNFFFNKFF